MGMYFNVKKDKEEKCPYCNEEFIGGYQSKESIDNHDVWGGCCEKHKEPLPTLEKNEVTHYYTSCSSCKEWIEYNLVDGDYILTKLK